MEKNRIYIFNSSNEKLKEILLGEIKRKISYFNKKSEPILLLSHKNIKSTVDRCQADIDAFSKHRIPLTALFFYQFDDDLYSSIEVCRFLLHAQYKVCSEFPSSIDMTNQELSILENYDCNFDIFLDENPWFSYVQTFNNIVNSFLEKNIDKIYISRKEVWNVLFSLLEIKKF